MTTAYTSLLGLALPVTGELSGTWGDTVNDYITQYLDASVAGTQTISGSQTAVTLSKTTNASLSQAGSGATGSSQYNVINCTGNPASMLTVTVPAASKTYVVVNATSTNQDVKIVGAGPTTGVTLVAGERAIIAWNGSDFIKVATSTADGVTTFSAGTTGFTPSTATSGAVTLAGTLATTNGGTGLTSFTANRVFYASSTSAIGQSANLTFDGTTLTAANFTDSSLTSGRVTYATTGGNLTDSANLTFDGTNLTLGGGTANGVAYLNGSKVLTTGSDVVYTGNFGIGTSSPTYKLNVVSGAGAQNIFQAGQSGVSNGYTITSDGTNLTYQWFTPSTEAMRLTSTGLGIGTSSPSYKLQVAGTVGVSGIITSTVTSGQVVKAESGGTGILYSNFTNTGGTFLYGIDNSTGSAIFSGSSNYAGFIGTSGATPLVFATNGTVRATLDSSGNLGLGVTPSAFTANTKALQIKNAALWNDDYAAKTSIGYNAYQDTDTTYRYIASSIPAGRYDIVQNSHRWYTAASGTAGNLISFTQAMTLDASGGLLVGTTSNANSYRVIFQGKNTTTSLGGEAVLNLFDGNANNEYNNLRFATSSDGPLAVIGAKAVTGGAYPSSVGQLEFGVQNGASTNTVMTLDASGNLLVGTTSSTPANANGLIAYGGTDAGIVYLQRTTGTDQLRFYVGGNRLGYLNTASSAVTLGTANFPLVFATNDTERARITSGGDLLVGTTSVSVSTAGSIPISPSGNGTGIPFVGCGGNSSDNALVTFALYSTSLAQYQFYVGYGGSVYARNTSIVSLSDQREKENIRPLETGLTEVMALQPRRFDWKNGSGSNVAGFVAQEVQAVLPDLIDEYKINEEETRMALKMGDILPTLVKAIQEQQAIITDLRARVAQLEAK